MFKRNMNKRGVSVMIGYILLIGIAITVSVFVYGWVKTYVPSDVQGCPDGTSVSIKEAVCSNISDVYKLNLTIKNKGRFDVAGYFIHATNESGQELATLDLSSVLGGTSGDVFENSILFGTVGTNSIKPNNEKKAAFNLDGEIFSVEIIPVRFEEKDNKNVMISCGNARVSEVVDCG